MKKYVLSQNESVAPFFTCRSCSPGIPQIIVLSSDTLTGADNTDDVSVFQQWPIYIYMHPTTIFETALSTPPRQTNPLDLPTTSVWHSREYTHPRRASTTSAIVFLLHFTGGGRGSSEGAHMSNGRPRIDRGGYINSWHRAHQEGFAHDPEPRQ